MIPRGKKKKKREWSVKDKIIISKEINRKLKLRRRRKKNQGRQTVRKK